MTAIPKDAEHAARVLVSMCDAEKEMQSCVAKEAVPKSKLRVPCPPPGIYPGVPHDVYRLWKAVCQSDLKRLQKSPAHLQAYRDDPPEQTPAMRLGSAFHAYFLDAATVFHSVYVAVPDGLDRRTKEGKAWMDSVGDREVLSADDCAAITGMSNSLRTQPVIVAMDALSSFAVNHRQNEVSIVWLDAATGTLCKGRLDMIRETGPDSWTIVDPKTCADASPEDFGKAAFNLGYHIQAAFYLWGCASLGLSVDKFLFAAVEKTQPYASAVYELDEDFLSLGWREVRGLLDLYAECERTQTWPGYSPEPVTLSPPAWATKGL